MATTTNLTTTYDGEFAGKYIGAALLAGNTLSQNLITIVPNIAYKQNMGRIELSGLTKNASCDFDPTGTLTKTERILQPKELQVNLTQCKKDWIADWEAAQMGFSAFKNMPPKAAEYIIARLAARVAQVTELDIWGGSDTDGHFAGFATLLTTDAALPTANEVAGTTVTSANAIAELNKIVSAIPNTLYGREDLYIYASPNIARAYIQALGGFGTGGLGSAGIDNKGGMWYNGGALSVSGVKIAVANGLGANVAIATTKDNLFFGTGLMSDHNEVQLIDTAATLGDQNVRFVMRYTAGVQYGIVEDIVTYGITNAAN